MLCRSAPIIALHGFLGSPFDWDGFKAIRIPPTLDEIDAPKGSILMGYSMGGRIALQLAAKHPNRYSGLILIGAHPGLLEKEKKARRQFENHWLQAFEHESREKALRLWYNQPIFDSLRASDQFETILARRQKDPSPWQYMQTYRLSTQTLMKPQIPTLYIYGEHDAKYAKIAQGFENRLMIPNAGHAPHLENPQLFSDLLDQKLV